MTVKERLHQLVDELPEPEAARFLEELEKAPCPSERVSALGRFAHVRTSSEEFIRRKQDEIALEEEQSARRWAGKEG